MKSRGFEEHESSRPFSVPDPRPAAVSKLAIGRATTQVRTEQGQKTVRYSTLPREAVILAIDGRVRLFLNSEQSNVVVSDLAVSEGEDQSVEMKAIGVVQPGPEDDDHVREELVVIQGDRKHVREDGVEGTVEGEAELIEKYVQRHPEQFVTNPKE